MATKLTDLSPSEAHTALDAREAEERAEELLPTTKAAARLGVSPAFLERDRWAGKREGKGPLIPYVVIGNRAVRYRRADLDAHIARNLKT